MKGEENLKDQDSLFGDGLDIFYQKKSKRILEK